MFDIDGNVLMTNCSNASMRNSFNHEIIQNTLNRNQQLNHIQAIGAGGGPHAYISPMTNFHKKVSEVLDE
jgi:hypothetical protein